MNYRHLFHAGNFADVFKHIILLAIAKSFLRKETPFCYLDTHASTGCYDLLSDVAQKTKEYENGIMKLWHAENMPELVKQYMMCVQDKNQNNTIRFYPGSSDIVKSVCRLQDRMILCELHEEDCRILKKYYEQNKRIAVHQQNGYQALKAFLPPQEKRGFVLIDPPYENPNEFSVVLTALCIALKRFETGVYAIWYPIKDRQSIQRFYESLKEKISRPILINELCIYPDNLATHLNGCGLAIINPPFQLDEQLNKILPWLWSVLSIQNQGHSQVKFL